METTLRRKHLGRNVQRIREMLELDRSALADRLGKTIVEIDEIEQTEDIDEHTIKEIASHLEIPTKLLYNLHLDEGTMNFISNTFNMSDTSIGANNNCTLMFDQSEKVTKVYREKEELYERMLQNDREMIEELKQLLKAQI